jgi:hypothetical protein
MGRVKAEWMEAQEPGWSAPDDCVCDNCAEDDYLKDLIRRTASASTCDYCGRKEAWDIATYRNRRVSPLQAIDITTKT